MDSPTPHTPPLPTPRLDSDSPPAELTPPTGPAPRSPEAAPPQVPAALHPTALQPTAKKRSDTVNVGRVATVLAALLVAMATAVALCWAVMPPPRGAVAAEWRTPATVFPADMATLRPWRYVVLHQTGAAAGNASGPEVFCAGDTGAGSRSASHFVIGNGRGLGDGELAVTARWMHQQTALAPATGNPEAPGRTATVDIEVVARYGISVTLAGDLAGHKPTPKQMDTLAGLVYTLCDRFAIPLTDVYLHSDLEPVSCPGPQLPAGDLFRRVGEKCRSKARLH